MLRPWDYVLTSTGRAGRLPFLVCCVLLIGLWAAFDLTTPSPWRDWAACVVAPAGLYLGACVLSLRLHDRSRAGWWCWLVLAAFVIGWPLIGAVIRGAPLDALPVWRWIGVAVLGMAFIELGLRPGVKGFNRFGAAPGESD